MSRKQKTINKVAHDFYTILYIFTFLFTAIAFVMAVTSNSVNVGIVSLVSLVAGVVFVRKAKKNFTR